MSQLVLLLLLAPGALLVLADGLEDYNMLDETYRKGVDLAVEQVNSHGKIQHKFLFLKSQHKADVESGFGVRYIYHHFYLKATTCARQSITVDPKQCLFRNDRPLIDCAVCYKWVDGGIGTEPKPYIHCIQRPALTKKMQTERQEHWNKMTYSHGALTLLASKGSN